MSEREEKLALPYKDCLTCGSRWEWNPPVRIKGHDLVRCVECKAVYPLASATPAPGYAQGFGACREAAKKIADHHAIGNDDEYDAADIGGCTTAMAISDAIAALPAPAVVEVTEEQLASVYGATLARSICRSYTILAKPEQEGQGS